MKATANRNRQDHHRQPDPLFEGALEKSRKDMQAHWPEIDTAILLLGRTLDAALAIVQADENRPTR